MKSREIKENAARRRNRVSHDGWLCHIVSRPDEAPALRDRWEPHIFSEAERGEAERRRVLTHRYLILLVSAPGLEPGTS